MPKLHPETVNFNDRWVLSSVALPCAGTNTIANIAAIEVTFTSGLSLRLIQVLRKSKGNSNPLFRPSIHSSGIQSPV